MLFSPVNTEFSTIPSCEMIYEPSAGQLYELQQGYIAFCVHRGWL